MQRLKGVPTSATILVVLMITHFVRTKDSSLSRSLLFLETFRQQKLTTDFATYLATKLG
jgi:hypothetical protein